MPYLDMRFGKIQLRYYMNKKLNISCLLLLVYAVSINTFASTKTEIFVGKLLKAAKNRTKQLVIYNGAYIKISYPNGDVPKNIGVCTDVIVRSYRKLGIDLQKQVHEDISKNFSSYPSKRIWGLKNPDKNIDHRRVPNLRAFFKRHGETLKITKDPADYKPGNLVTWVLPGNLPHIGIVINEKSKDGKRPLIVHNIGAGPVVEDMLFDYKITGHYRYYGKNRN